MVRIGEFFGCTEEEKNSEDALKCGFQISIGTRSPRLTVPEIPPGFNFLSYRQSLLSNIYTAGFQANATRCLTWDSDCALRDDVPPTSSSLRYPSAPFLYNNTLYIPDTGNARVVTIEQFEQRIQACGRLNPLTDAEDGSCVFDRVLGPNNFTERDCIRGGERFFNPATLSSTSYPAHGIYALVGSVACRQDQHISLDAGRAAAGLFDRDLPVVDFGDAILSDLSLSGALMERTRQTFRAPTKIRVSQDGRLYVMDSGYSYIVSGPNAATLPPRLMIWTTNPMTGETPCRAEGCAADFVVGPPSVQSTFVHKASEELWHNIWPSGGFPISDFEIIPSGNAKGLWFVTGVDPRLIYVADPSKLSLAFNPANFRVFNNRTLPYTEEPFHRRGALSGIVATPDGRIIMASDPLQNTYFTWTLQGVSLK